MKGENLDSSALVRGRCRSIVPQAARRSRGQTYCAAARAGGDRRRSELRGSARSREPSRFHSQGRSRQQGSARGAVLVATCARRSARRGRRSRCTHPRGQRARRYPDGLDQDREATRGHVVWRSAIMAYARCRRARSGISANLVSIRRVDHARSGRAIMRE